MHIRWEIIAVVISTFNAILKAFVTPHGDSQVIQIVQEKPSLRVSRDQKKGHTIENDWLSLSVFNV